MYSPMVPPNNSEELLVYLNEEFFRVGLNLNQLLEGIYEIHYSAPVRVKPGMVLYFSGPASPLGTGLEGLYRYSLAGTWVYIG